jgi:hypothetical protein
MADIFNSYPGMVNIFGGDSNYFPGRIKLKTPSGGYVQFTAALFSGIDYDQETIQQFQLSMQDSVYIYVFGDGMGKIVLNGLAFAGTCEGAEGLSQVMLIYNQSRVTKLEKPVVVLVGNQRVEGFLTQFNVNMQGASDNPATLGLYKFRMIIHTLPES